MPDNLTYARHGRGAARPYVYAHADAVELCKAAFGAEVVESMGGDGGAHFELGIADSVIVIEVGETFPGNPGPCSVYVYVPDVDAAYERAVAAGAKPLSTPEDKPYEERQAGVTDRFGNTWWIAAYTG